MSTLFPSKRPRPRPHAINKTNSADNVQLPAHAENSLSPPPPPISKGRVSSSTTAKTEPGADVKRESSPGFEAIPAPPGAARAGSSSSDRSHAPGRFSAAPPNSARQQNDDDDDFFVRSRRRPSSREPSNTQAMAGKGKGRAFSALDFLPEDAAADIHLSNNTRGQEDDEGSDDDGSSTESDSSGQQSSPARAKRRKLKAGQEDTGKKDSSALPAWTKARGGRKRKPKSDSPPPISITIDDSDDDDPAVVKAEGSGPKRRKRAAEQRVSLTPPPDDRLYNRTEWSNYIKQAVHGADGPQQIDDDEDPIFAQLRDEDDDISEVGPPDLNPKLARFLTGSSTTRAGGIARRRAQQNDIGSEKAAASASNTAANGASKRNAEAGPSRTTRSSGDTNLEAINIDDDSAEEQRPQKKKEKRSDGDSDDSIMLLPRAPPKRTSSEVSSSPVRRQSMASQDKMRAADPEVAPSSSPPQSIQDPLASTSFDAAAGADVSVDLRPQTPVVEKIMVKVHSQSGLKLRLKLSLTTKIATIIETVKDRAMKKSMLPSGAKVKLIFDGEVLDPNETIQDHDMEDEDQLEATW
ncbi:hypothetical protein CF319_g6717 [Tilletia indica]|nr:hypothetical protein CF319_g6717 [Tilletia indica]